MKHPLLILSCLIFSLLPCCNSNKQQTNTKKAVAGNIAGRECENRDVKDGIYIHQVKGKKETLVKTMPISTIHRYQEYKWGFIKNYWTKNYKTFR